MKYAGFWRRVVAWTIDGVLVSAVVTLVGLGLNSVFGDVVRVNPNFNYKVAQDTVLDQRVRVGEDGIKELVTAFEKKETYFGLWSLYSRGETIRKENSRTTRFEWWPIDPDTKIRVMRLYTSTIEFLLFFFVYLPLAEASRWQASIGKLIMGIRVVDLEGRRVSFKRALGRNAGKIVSIAVLLIGLLMASWTRRRQGLRDKMAKTLVIRRPLTQKDLDEIYA